jgi:hypothetical protein
MTLFFLVASSALGQALTGAYSVRGTVRNAVTGQAVRNAVVVLERVPDAKLPTEPVVENSGMPERKAAISGPGGEFHFDGLRAGQYHYLARRPDFMAEHESPQKPGVFVVPRSPSDGPIQLSLTPYGAIQGNVVNQFGEPVESALVIVLSAGIRDGERTTSQVARLQTYHRGHFQATQLPPGRYYVKVAGRDGGTETHLGPEKVHYAPWESFTPAYFGGAPDRASATPIEVAAGALVQADFRVNFERAFRIRGKIKDYRPSEPVSFELLRGNEPGEPQRGVLDRVTGEFEILDVLPGAYTLRATQAETRDEVAVTVAGEDVVDISVALAPGVTVSGSTHFVSTSSPGASAVPDDVQFLATCRVGLREHGHPDSERGAIPNGPSQFTIPDVFPGEYRVLINCYGGYAVSASFDGVDVLTNPIISISKGATPRIEISCQLGGGSLKARFAAEIPSEAAVLLAPSFPTFTGPVLSPVSVLGPTFPRQAIFGGLAPGEYSVYGLLNSEEVEFRNPAVLQSLTGGKTVRIEDGKTTEVVIQKVSK